MNHARLRGSMSLGRRDFCARTPGRGGPRGLHKGRGTVTGKIVIIIKSIVIENGQLSQIYFL